jgi:hypothetical protein
MQANGGDIIELIRVGEWSILNMLQLYDREEGPGIVHRPCDGWIRFGMREEALYCRSCHEAIPDEIVTLWLLLSADKSCSNDFYKKNLTSEGVSS